MKPNLDLLLEGTVKRVSREATKAVSIELTGKLGELAGEYKEFVEEKKEAKKRTRKKKEPAEEAKALKPEVEKPKYYTYEDYPIEDLLLYAGLDCIATSGIATKIMAKASVRPRYEEIVPGPDGRLKSVIKELPSVADSYFAYTSEAFDFIIDLELNGIKYNVEKSRVMSARMAKEIEELETEIFSQIGPRFNLDSGPLLAEFLYGQKGFEVTAFTKTGEPSTDGDAIKSLAKKYVDEPWLIPLAKRGDLASLWRTFLKTYVEDFVKPDGRIHPSYNLHGTGSFRISGEEPNLTQLPRPKHGYNIRTLFEVDEGEVFFCFDFSSAEVKILGALCKDPALLQAIKEGKDFHSLSASKMFGIEYDDFVDVLDDGDHVKYPKELYKDYKEKRQYSKALTFGIRYGTLIVVMRFSKPAQLLEP